MKKMVVVMGTGSIGLRHLEVLRRMEDVNVVAVPVHREKIPILEKDGFVCAKDLQQAVSRGASFCIIATDTCRHTDHGLMALDLGLDVLIEKPLSVSLEAALPLYKKAKELDRNVFVGCVLRFSESLNVFRTQLKEIGRIHVVSVECRSYLPDWRPDRPYRVSYSARAGEGGVLRDLIHEIDYAGWIFGWPRNVSSSLCNLRRLQIETEEMANLYWHTGENISVSLGLDYLSRIPRRQMKVEGENGRLIWDGIEQKVILEKPGYKPEVFSSAQTRDEMFLEQAKCFLNSRSLVSSPDMATIEEGLRALAVCDAARKSSVNRREEEVLWVK